MTSVLNYKWATSPQDTFVYCTSVAKYLYRNIYSCQFITVSSFVVYCMMIDSDAV